MMNATLDRQNETIYHYKPLYCRSSLALSRKNVEDGTKLVLPRLNELTGKLLIDFSCALAILSQLQAGTKNSEHFRNSILQHNAAK